MKKIKRYFKNKMLCLLKPLIDEILEDERRNMSQAYTDIYVLQNHVAHIGLNMPGTDNDGYNLIRAGNFSPVGYQKLVASGLVSAGNLNFNLSMGEFS